MPKTREKNFIRRSLVLGGPRSWGLLPSLKAPDLTSRRLTIFFSFSTRSIIMNNIQYRRTVPEDAQVLKNLVPNVFYKREPLGNALTIRPSVEAIATVSDRIVHATVESPDNLSIVAVDNTYKGNPRSIVGFILARPMCSPDPFGDMSEFADPTMFPILEVIDRIHLEVEEEFPGFHDMSDATNFEIVGVVDEYLTRGIVKDMAIVAGDELLKAGYKKAVFATASENIKVTSSNWVGAHIIHSLDLKAFEMKGAKVFTNVKNEVLQLVVLDYSQGRRTNAKL
ncbi:hypothetical protein BC938DRAFT_479451 [Jimgerdemannia flammicorona]|uniref:N-acetyltransferase domain-containing protein n=1 Tax=Jimgerdemannia flammicorona TaxID=994334 RepID=A0A433QKT9_9FUNG|nr:hypothetical protein BC938DRAFT_479451 [Jimgerdemannia flammicorona]